MQNGDGSNPARSLEEVHQQLCIKNQISYRLQKNNTTFKETYINIKNDNLPCTDRIFAHVQEQDVPLQMIREAKIH